VIDLHCHVLPGVDDGPATLDETLELCRAALAAGTQTVVATPHVSWEWPGVTSHVVHEGVERVSAALREHEIELDVLPGAEIAMTRAGELPDDELAALRIGGGPFLLLECPLSPAAAGIDRLVASLVERGHRILLAHPERSPALQRHPELLRELVHEHGALTSVTAAAFTGRFGSTVQRFARGMLEQGLVHDIASDGHGADMGRPPSIGPELERAGFGERADWHARAVPRAILDGSPLPPPPPLPQLAPRRGLLARLRRA
jgi:protein-tyrosine phosphatase